MYDPSDRPDEKYSLVFNRMSPSAWNRDHGDQIFYTLGFLEHLESRGVKVINGFKAFASELSKAGQLVLMEKLGKAYPKARVIHRPEQRWPLQKSALAHCREAEHRRIRGWREALRWCVATAARD